MKPSNIIRSTLTALKDETVPLNKAEFVHQIQCSDCARMYIGEVKRNLGKRLMEHCPKSSTFWVHMEEFYHWFHVDQVRIWP